MKKSRRNRRRAVITPQPIRCDGPTPAAPSTGGIIKPDTRGPSLQQLTEESSDTWLPGRVVLVILALSVILITTIVVLIHAGFGAAR